MEAIPRGNTSGLTPTDDVEAAKAAHPQWFPERPVVLTLHPVPPFVPTSFEMHLIKNSVCKALDRHWFRAKGAAKHSSFLKLGVRDDVGHNLGGCSMGVHILTTLDEADVTVSVGRGMDVCDPEECLAFKKYVDEDHPVPLSEGQAACANPACPLAGQGMMLKKCSKCQRVGYCSARCQNAHWRQHKRDCV